MCRVYRGVHYVKEEVQREKKEKRSGMPEACVLFFIWSSTDYTFGCDSSTFYCTFIYYPFLIYPLSQANHLESIARITWNLFKSATLNFKFMYFRFSCIWLKYTGPSILWGAPKCNKKLRCFKHFSWNIYFICGKRLKCFTSSSRWFLILLFHILLL